MGLTLTTLFSSYIPYVLNCRQINITAFRLEPLVQQNEANVVVRGSFWNIFWNNMHDELLFHEQSKYLSLTVTAMLEFCWS